MKIKLNFLHMYCRNKRNIKIINCCNTSYSLCPIYIKKKSKINRTRIKPGEGGGAEGQCSPPPPCPSLMQSKNPFLEIIQFLFYFLTKSIWNMFLRLLERLKCKILKLWWTARTTYITVTIHFWPLHFYRYTTGPDQRN